MTVEARFNPFPGLRSFEPDEDHLFFGRETQVDSLLGRLRRTRFLGVVGGSGSGKSSLVKSGLMPSLCSGYMVQAGSSWRVALLRPGGDPIHNLSIALNEPGVLGGDPSMAELNVALLDASLRRSGQGLVEAVRQARITAGDNLLVVVDQFEELFRFKQVRAEAGARDEAVGFVKLLLEAARQNDVPIYVVLTMRSEFIGSCAEFPGLAEAVNDGQYLIPRLTRDELRLAITGPVAVGGGEIAPRLVTRVLNEIGDDPDQLPVLQHALMRTWDAWASHAGRAPIDVDDYEAIGTMKNALSRHADEAYGELTAGRGPRVAELMFKALTDTTGQGLGLRRPCRVQELCDIADAPHDEVAAVIEAFRKPGRSFLVPSMATPLQPSTIVDLSHESLMRLWTRLITWTHEEARSAEIYRRLSRAATLHALNEAGLWRDPELQLAVNWNEAQHPTATWARRYDAEFERSTAFLAASRTSRDAEAAARDADAAARRLQERRVRKLTNTLFVVSVLLLVFSVFIVRVIRNLHTKANEAATRADDKARAGALAIIAAEDFHEKPDSIGASGLVAIEALRLDPLSSVARHTLMDILRLLPPRPVIPARQGHTKAVHHMVVDRNGRLMVTAGSDGKVILWDFAKHEMRMPLGETLDAPARGLAISGDGHWVAAASPSTIYVWEGETGNPVTQFPLTGASALAFSPDRTRLAISMGREPYRQFSTADWSDVSLDNPPPAEEVAFSPNGDRLVLATTTGIRLASEQRDAADTDGCHSIQFEADGDLVATCPEGVISFSLDGAALRRNSRKTVARKIPEEFHTFSVNSSSSRRLFIGRSAERPSDIVSVFEASGEEYLRLPKPTTSLAVPPIGDWIATGNAAGAVVFWRLAHGLAPQSLGYRGEDYKGVVADLTFSHNERWLAIVEHDGWVRVFDRASGLPVNARRLPLEPGEELLHPRFSPDDSLLAVSGSDGLRFIQTADWQPLDDRRVRTRENVFSFFFSLGGDSLIVAEQAQGLLRRFRVHSWAELPPITSRPEDVIYVTWDRRWIAIVDQSPTGTFRLLDANSGQITPPAAIPQLPELSKTPTAAELTRAIDDSGEWIVLPDEQNWLSGDADGGDWWTLDVTTIGTPVLVIREKLTGHKVADLVHDSTVNSVAISRLGNWIATASREDQKAFLWPWSQEHLITLACALIPDNLTREEWKERHLEDLGLGPLRPTCPPPAK